MFKSLKHWFDALPGARSDFAVDDEAAHAALASLLMHVIRADTLESERERHRFEQILAEEFDLDHEHIARLHRGASTLESDLAADLATVREHLIANPGARLGLLRKLNHLVALDGVDARELKVFNTAVAALFPEVARRSREPWQDAD